MSNSTTLLDTISTSSSNKEAVANALFDAMSPGSLCGRHSSATSGLTWGYYGGVYFVASVANAIANGTVALTASATNYIQANATTGAVTSNTTGFTAGAIPLYTIVTGASAVTSYTDQRSFQYSAVPSSAVVVNPVNMVSFYPGVPAASAIMLSAFTLEATTFAAAMTNSVAIAGTAATAAVSLIIQRVTAAGVATTIGSIAFAAGGTTGTVSLTAALTTTAGDRIRVVNASTADATLANIDIGLYGTR